MHIMNKMCHFREQIYSGPEEFDPTLMEPDLISLELEVGPSILCLYGSLLRNFLHVKVGA